jgi:hypothetical protein
MEYYSLLGKIHGHLAPRTYVEVGVRHGESMTLALPGTRSIGIDPAADVRFPLGPHARLFAMTSDEFFAGDHLRQALGGLPVDLAFIDGMHLFEYALRDFANLERACAPGSVILVHDCLPIDAVTSARDRTTDVWSGDVWKLVVCLRRYRPDLSVTTIDVGPTGLGVITGLDPASGVLLANLEALYDEFVPLGYDDLLADGKGAALNCVPFDWDTVARVLAHRVGSFAP